MLLRFENPLCAYFTNLNLYYPPLHWLSVVLKLQIIISCKRKVKYGVRLLKKSGINK